MRQPPCVPVSSNDAPSGRSSLPRGARKTRGEASRRVREVPIRDAYAREQSSATMEAPARKSALIGRRNPNGKISRSHDSEVECAAVEEHERTLGEDVPHDHVGEAEQSTDRLFTDHGTLRTADRREVASCASVR
jgi:hypothetical protein